MVGVYSRWIGTSFEVFTQNWIKNGLVCLILLAVFFFKPNWKKLQTRDLPWITLWAFSSTAAITLFFIAVNQLSIGLAILIFYVGSNLSSYLSGKLFFQEKLNLVKIIAIALSLVGLYLIYQNQITSNISYFAGLAFLSGISTGFFNTISKKFSHFYPFLQLAFIDAGFTFIVSIILGLILREKHPTVSLSVPWLALIAATMSQIIQVSLLIYGFKKVEAQIGALVMPLEAVWATLFGFIFFGEAITLTILVGGGLILGGVILPQIKWKQLRNTT